MNEILHGVRVVFLKDLRIEARTKEIVTTTALFALLVVVMSSLAFSFDRNFSRAIAPGVLWVSIAFAGQLATARSWGRERDLEVMRGLLLSPIPRASIFLGKTLSNLLFLALVEALVIPLVALFFSIDLLAVLPILSLLVVLGTLGFVSASTLFGALLVRGQTREMVLSIVVFPLITPALFIAVVATRQLFAGATMNEVIGWVKILAAFDVVFLTAGLVLFEPLLAD